MTELALDLSVRRPDFDLSVTCALPLTGVTAIFGPSGAGKSTLLRAIAGLEKPEGTVRFAGEIWSGPGQFIPPHKRRVGYVFQEPRLFAHLDVRGNLGFAARRAKAPVSMDEVVRYLDLSRLLDRRPHQLSGGEAQRVALGRALLSAPRLLVMDEPLSALDAQRRAEILPYVEAIRDGAGLPILYVSHNFAEVARLAAQILHLRDGRVAGFGPATEVLTDIAGTLPADEAQSVIEATVRARTADGLTELRFAGGVILTPEAMGALGSTVRISVRARDVMLSLDAPSGLSALNILPAVVTAVTPDGASATVTLDAGGTRLLARITRRSAETLGLAPGVSCHAILKSVALVRG